MAAWHVRMKARGNVRCSNTQIQGCSEAAVGGWRETAWREVLEEQSWHRNDTA